MTTQEAIAETHKNLDELLKLHKKQTSNWGQVKPLLDANGPHFEAMTNHIDGLQFNQKNTLHILKTILMILGRLELQTRGL